MDHRMRVNPAPVYLFLLIYTCAHAFIPGADGPVSSQEALEGDSTTLLCDSTPDTSNDELMLLVWYRNNAPIYSFDARIGAEWSNPHFNTTGRLVADLNQQPTVLTIHHLRADDQALFHCRVDFALSQTRNLGVNLTVVELPFEPFFMDELHNKVDKKIGPYHEGDTLVLTCLVIGGRPPPRISWYSGETLVDASDCDSETPDIRENELYLPLTRENAAALSCRASNTRLAPPVIATLEVELYLPAYNVSIHFVEGTVDETLQVGKPALIHCQAYGSHPPPDLSWWLDHRHLTQHSNQTWNNKTKAATSQLMLIPSVVDNGATLACVATNTIMERSRGSKADVITLNVTYSPIVEVSRIGDGRLNEVVELDSLHLECEVRANPPVDRFMWYFNDSRIIAGSIWGDEVTSHKLYIEEATRQHAGRYSCAASNNVGETRAEHISITVFYPPECTERGIVLVKETLHCRVRALPAPDTFFWHVQPSGFDVQHLTTGSAILPLSQITGPLSGSLKASCEAGNGVASQEKPCEKTLSLESLRPQQPQQCDMAYEYGEFQMRCMPVENATYYEVSVWRMSTTNTSLILERRGSMGFGSGQAMAQGGAAWLVRGGLGKLKFGDEAGASACNRYGCSRALLLRPTENLLHAASPPWWHFLLEKDVGISLGAVVLVAVFLISTTLAVRLARRPRSKAPAPVIQVLQLDEVARDYLDNIGGRT
ncbi:hemicentin-2-like isoform X2 [Pectinophora gossypiella]|uniref:hemicentin-2-like isoform X2 n=1 Tax=Pectinophora gossypiella TaxID=13191 RepID=UPI00214EA81B|nr:hemicentin-2-like isoform X2 [Pectinophora gossypiella]